MIVVITSEAEADRNLRRGAKPTERAQARARAATTVRVTGGCAAGVPFGPAPRARGHSQAAIRPVLIFYRVGDDAIEVIHILHGACDYEALLFPEE